VEIDVINPRLLPPDMTDRWRALQRLDPAWDSPFLSPLWAKAAERARGVPDGGVRVAALLVAGRFCGFMAARAGGVTAMAAGAPMCDYQGLVAEPGLMVDPKQLARALGVHRFDFTHMLEAQSAFAPHAQGRADSWICDLADGYEAYAAERKAAGVDTLKDLDKKRRRAERESGRVVFTAFSDSRADFERLLVLKRAQFLATGQTNIFAAGWPLRLVEDLFRTREPDFGGGLFTLHIGDRLAAAQFNLAGARSLHAWLIAHEPAFERYSPGLLLFQSMLRWMDETPYDRLDFGPGDYRFKRQLANGRQGLMHGYVAIPSPAALVRGAAYRVRRAAEALPLGEVSHLPGKAMRRLDLLRGLR